MADQRRQTLIQIDARQAASRLRNERSNGALLQSNDEMQFARPAGFEPATCGFEVRRSIQLS